MARVRREVRSLGATWNPTMLWYARAVTEMRKRPITQKTSWRYLAAMHDIDPARWTTFKELTQGEAVPPAAEQKKYWKQCQHDTWYFWPWHRAFLMTFEDIVRDTIKALNGPWQDWSLPYWNYSSSAAARSIPPAFLEGKLPDGSKNDLHLDGRFGRAVAANSANLQGLGDGDFVGRIGDAHPGVGGGETGFSLNGDQTGLIEDTPHGAVHVDVGGRKNGLTGIMGSPNTAALDPIFWLHHCNIDRLWEVWVRRDAHNKNPSDKHWMDGPTQPRAFALFGPDGKDRPCNPKDVIALSALGYSYDDVSDPLGGASRRKLRLTAFAARVATPIKDIEPMSGHATSEIMGSNDTPLKLGPEPATSEITLADRPKKRLLSTFSAKLADAATPGEPDRVFLKLENIKGNAPGNFDVVIKTAGDEKIPAGSISLFGLAEASQPDGHKAGSGLTRSIEITSAIDRLKAAGGSLDKLHVEIVPQSEVLASDQITVGQMTVHRVSGD